MVGIEHICGAIGPWSKVVLESLTFLSSLVFVVLIGLRIAATL